MNTTHENSPSQPDINDATETTITVRLSVALKESLRQNAEARRLNLSDYVRVKLAGDSLPKRRPSKPRISPIERELLIELNRIGSNLNQAVRKLNAQNNQGFADRQILTDLLSAIQKIELALSSEGCE